MCEFGKSGQDFREKSKLWLWLAFLPARIPGIFALYLCERYTPPVPAGDQWGQTAENVVKADGEGVNFADFNTPWNHGRMTVPRLRT